MECLQASPCQAWSQRLLDRECSCHLVLTHASGLLRNVSIGTKAATSRPNHGTNIRRFKFMSIQRFGAVDIDGLWELRKAKCSGPRFTGFDERNDMLRVRGRWHQHIPGTEYLAANPIVIPKLTRLIQSCANASSDVVFSQLISSAPTQDLFASLSPELRIMVLESLGPRDVANLRLSSREFSQLPQAYFKHLIKKEMPWVWEAHDTQFGLGLLKRGIDWFALWTRLCDSDGGDCADEKRRAAAGGDRFHTYDDKKGEIKGLRNRRMVYRDISIILDMMASQAKTS